jgi:hypothetical protein
MVKGSLRADGIVLTAIHISFLTESAWDIKGEAKIVDGVSGQTHATTTATQWPPEVVQKIKELVDVMERAIGQRLFTESVQQNAEGKPGMALSPPPGLGEHLGDAPTL